MEILHVRDLIGKHIHFIGIGGISMSGLAEILHEKGCQVSGSDLRLSPLTERLSNNGIAVFKGHDGKNIEGADLIIYTAAIHEDNPELTEAKKRSIPCMDRATLLGQIMETYPFAIGVAGTHGKTTTTSMLSMIMNQADLDPTVLVGGELDEIGGNVRAGHSKYFITEACEYVDSFLKFHPDMAMILNIDRDHLDYFRDIDQIYDSFVKYAALVPKTGYVIGCGDDPLVSGLMEQADCHTISYGIDHPADWTAREISYDQEGCASFMAVKNGKTFGTFGLKVPGRHNIYNALASIAAADVMGIPAGRIRHTLSLYHGAHRRFEVKGKTTNGATIVDDYAHHPTEIKATIQAALHYPHNRLWCIFQPHTYTRTKKLFREFTEAFQGVDTLILADIYAAREKDTGEISSRMLAEAISKKGQDCTYLPDFKEIEDTIRKRARTGDLILTMGAGNINQVGDDLKSSGK